VNNINDGGPAFPCEANNYHESLTGMTLRQWYAGMALQGLAWGRRGDAAFMDASNLAFGLADAMLAHEAKELEAQP